MMMLFDMDDEHDLRVLSAANAMVHRIRHREVSATEVVRCYDAMRGGDEIALIAWGVLAGIFTFEHLGFSAQCWRP